MPLSVMPPAANTLPVWPDMAITRRALSAASAAMASIMARAISRRPEDADSPEKNALADEFQSGVPVPFMLHDERTPPAPGAEASASAENRAKAAGES